MALRAFLFGVNSRGLQYSDIDVTRMKNALESCGGLCTIGAGNKSAVLSQIDEFCDSLSSSDDVIFYYSGHGGVVRNNLFFLIGSDFYKNSDIISFSEVAQRFAIGIGASKSFVLDCCNALSAAFSFNAIMDDHYLLVTSSKRLEPSKENNIISGSVFTYHFTECITKHYLEAAHPNNPAIFTLRSAVEHTVHFIERFNKENGTKYASPNIYGNAASDIVLRNLNNEPIHYRTYLNSLIYCCTSCDGACYRNKPWCSGIFQTLYYDTGYVSPDFTCLKSDGTQEQSDFESFVELCVTDREPSAPYLILGDTGVGKTTACIYLFRKLADRYLSSENNASIPIFVPLSTLANIPLLEISVPHILRDICGITASETEILEFVRSKRYWFILDGLDEIVDISSLSNQHAAFYKIKPFLVSGNSVVVTCRTHYFTSSKQLEKLAKGEIFGTDLFHLFGKNLGSFALCELKELTDVQIIQLISRILPSVNAEATWEQISEIYDLADLAKRPILLRLILHDLEQILCMASNGISIGQCELYELYVTAWLKREVESKSISIAIDRKFEFHEYLAAYLWRNMVLSVNYRHLADHIRVSYKNDIFSGIDVVRHEYDVFNSSFLNRDGFGNYRFMHKSFLEYFIATKCLRDAEEGDLELWRVRWFEKEVASFLSCLISRPDKRAFVNYLVDMAASYNHPVGLWNILHTLSLLDKSILADFDSNKINTLIDRVYTESNAVLLRQYARVVAKFIGYDVGEELIDRVIDIVETDPVQNLENNDTYINYYGGKMSAIEALLDHLEYPSAKYDRQLHLKVLEQLADSRHAQRLSKIVGKWDNTKYLEYANNVIRLLDGRKSPQAE